MSFRRLYYGWFDPNKKVYRLSRYPPDATIRPSVDFEQKSDLLETAKKRRAEVMWWPPLREISS